MVGRKKKIPISVKMKEGLDLDFQPYYLDWQIVYAKVIDTTGRTNYQEYGVDMNFDKVIHLEANDITRAIDEFTLFCIDVMPYNNYNEYGEYIVKYKFPENNGIIIIGLERRNPISIPKLYYLKNNKVLAFDLDYSAENKTAYMNVGAYIPFDTNSIIWEKQAPEYTTQTNNRIKLIYTEQVGLDESYQPFAKLTFSGD